MQTKSLNILIAILLLSFMPSCSLLKNINFENRGWRKSDIHSNEIHDSIKVIKEYLNKKYPNIILSETISAKKQHVGGYNYSIKCAYYEKNSSQKLLKAFIYKDFDGKYYVRKIDLNSN